MDQNINLPNYLNRFNPEKGFDTILFRSDKVIQSDELNELESNLQTRIRNIADVLLKDGALIRDARIIVDQITGQTTCESGALFVDGTVRGVAPSTLQISTVGIVSVGVYLQETIITELEDPSLRNRALNTRGHGKPGAARLKKVLVWGFAGDNQAGKFFPVYTVDDGAVRSKEPPPQLDGVTQALARYDRDSSGGTYAVSGLTVTKNDDLISGEQVYSVSEGRARVSGFGVEIGTSRRVVYNALPDFRYIENEPHQSTTAGVQRVNFDKSPAANVVEVTIIAQKTIDVAHGGFTGAMDPLEDNSVLSILEVKQGATIFQVNTDYKLTAQQIDWTPAGAEPATGSTYKVTYQYLKKLVPAAFDPDGFTVEGAIVGTAILVSYNRMLPRIDRLCLDSNGGLIWLKGIAADRAPSAPSVPANLLSLASIYQSWRTNRQLLNDAVRVVSMDTLESYSRRLDYLTELMAQQRLEASSQMIEAGAKRGIFVDPFVSDAMRDQGLAQTGAIFSGELTLPVSTTAYALSGDVNAPASLNFSTIAILEQPLRTGSMKINPYMSFDPLPADIKLKPSVDRWTEVVTEWTSPTTQNITQNISGADRFIETNDTAFIGGSISNIERYESINDVTRVLNTSNKPAEFLRQTTVQFTIDGFDQNEQLQVVRFDGITVVAANVTQTQGTISGEFTIPAKVSAGNKRVEFIGANSSYGVAIYSGIGIVVTNVQQIVSVRSSGWLTFNDVFVGQNVRADPLAQTFTLTTSRQVSAIECWFTARGTSRLIVQIRETSSGMPNQNVIAQGRVDASQLDISGAVTAIAFERPVFLNANVEYALVLMCDDATTAVAVAELGKYDDHRDEWVTSQPYTVGVLLSSSNASTWNAHQDRDLAFRLLASSYTAPTRTIDLGGVDLVNVTDLMLLMLAETPSAQTRVEYQITLPDGSAINVDQGQPVKLSEVISGRFNVSAKLTGTVELSPILHPGATLVAGTVANQGDYISRLIPGGDDVRARIVVEANLPAGSNMSIDIAEETVGNAPPSYVAVPYVSSRQIANDWHELTYEKANFDTARFRSRITFSGNTASRPRLKNLRVISI